MPIQLANLIWIWRTRGCCFV